MSNRNKLIVGSLILFAIVGIPLNIYLEFHQDVIDTVAKEANSARAPTGLNGAKWMMSPNQVRTAFPSMKEVGPDAAGGIQYNDIGIYMSRPAQFEFHFQDNYLLLILITFLDDSSQDRFDAMNSSLTSLYGPMHDEAGADQSKYRFRSTRTNGRFMITHVVYQAEYGDHEQIILLRRSG